MTTYFITHTDIFGSFRYYQGLKTERGYRFAFAYDFTANINHAISYTLEEAKIIQKEASERCHPVNLEIYEWIPPTELRLGKKYDEKEHIIGLLTDLNKIEFFPCSYNGKVIQMAIDYIKEKT